MANQDPPSLYAAREPIFPRRVSGRFRSLKWWIMGITLGIYYLTPWIRWDRGPSLPDQAVLVTPPAHLRWYATRFGTYQVGPVLSEEQFEEDWGPLVITRADLTSMLARTWLALEGEVHPQEAMDATCTMVAMAFRALADAELGDAPPAHAAASVLQLWWLVEHDVRGDRRRVSAIGADGTPEVLWTQPPRGQ